MTTSRNFLLVAVIFATLALLLSGVQGQAETTTTVADTTTTAAAETTTTTAAATTTTAAAETTTTAAATTTTAAAETTTTAAGATTTTAAAETTTTAAVTTTTAAAETTTTAAGVTTTTAAGTTTVAPGTTTAAPATPAPTVPASSYLYYFSINTRNTSITPKWVVATIAQWVSLKPEQFFVWNTDVSTNYNPNYYSFNVAPLYDPANPRRFLEVEHIIYNFNSSQQQWLGVSSISRSYSGTVPIPVPTPAPPTTAGPATTAAPPTTTAAPVPVPVTPVPTPATTFYTLYGYVNCTGFDLMLFKQRVAWLMTTTFDRVAVHGVTAPLKTSGYSGFQPGLCLVAFNFTGPSGYYLTYNFPTSYDYQVSNAGIVGVRYTSTTINSDLYFYYQYSWDANIYYPAYNRWSMMNLIASVLNVPANRVVILSDLRSSGGSYANVYWTYTHTSDWTQTTREDLLVLTYYMSAAGYDSLYNNFNQTSSSSYYRLSVYPSIPGIATSTPSPTLPGGGKPLDFERIFTAKVMTAGYSNAFVQNGVAWALQVDATQVQVDSSMPWPNMPDFTQVKFQFKNKPGSKFNAAQLSTKFQQLNNVTLMEAGIYGYTSELTPAAKAKKYAGVIIGVVIAVVVVLIIVAVVVKMRSGGEAYKGEGDAPMTDYRAGGV
jgi:hypothetical protein